MRLYDTLSTKNERPGHPGHFGHSNIFTFSGMHLPPSLLISTLELRRIVMFLVGYERLAKGANIHLQTTTFAPFLATHDRFLSL